MRCPFCREDNDKVIDSRINEDGFVIRRRRHCNECGERYTTFERMAELQVTVIKKNQQREPFNSEKIMRGVMRACWKRPVTQEQIEELTASVEREIMIHYNGEIESYDIGKVTMKYLINLDQVAYVRFASVYREFNDLQDFINEVQHYLSLSKDQPGETVDP